MSIGGMFPDPADASEMTQERGPGNEPAFDDIDFDHSVFD